MERPRMILFDYGGTLMYEQNFDRRKGNAALFRYIKDNPENVTVDEFTDYFSALFDEIRALRGELIEIHETYLLRFALEHFGMTLAAPFEHTEAAIFDAITESHMVPHADEMLGYLRENGIRTGVVSNLCWSGGALSRRLCETFPDHRFEFIMTSSEYIFRKPDRHLFDLAVKKAGLLPGQIWYCGNDADCDIIGAHEAGLFPVMYDNKELPHFEKKDINRDIPEGIPHIRISSWEELKEHLSCIRNF